jgi:hypothetical protein
MGYFGPHSELNTANFSINVPWGPRATKCALQEITGDGAKSHVLTVGSTVGGEVLLSLFLAYLVFLVLSCHFLLGPAVPQLFDSFSCPS